MPKLAINGGKPIRTKKFLSQNPIEQEERDAVQRVLDRGILTSYRANKDYYKGDFEIKALVEEFCEMFGWEFAIPCNSATTGLMLSSMCVSTDAPFTVSPFSLSCSASMPVFAGKNIMFHDVDIDYYSIADEINGPVVDVALFGQSCMHNHTGFFIEDAAQALGAEGTTPDIRVHSFVGGKHISAGEGGMMCTNHPGTAERLRLLVNHAECINHSRNSSDPMIGGNFRMTEIQAALIRAQLPKFKKRLEIRRENCNYLSKRFSEMDYLDPPKLWRGPESHSYYCYPFNVKSRYHDPPRNDINKAVRAELANVRIVDGYVEPLYRFPCFPGYSGLRLHNTEELWKWRLSLIMDIAYPHTIEDMKDIADAYEKVWENREELYG